MCIMEASITIHLITREALLRDYLKTAFDAHLQ
jgi:hypothetical protein